MGEKEDAFAGEEREMQEEIEFRGLVTCSGTLMDNANLTILGTMNNNIHANTIRLTDDGSIFAIQEYDSAH